jgi:hypothetical protein
MSTMAIATSNPILNARHMVKLLVDKYTSKPFVRDSGFGRFYLIGFDSLGCYVWAPCDRAGNPIAQD